jgi:hypothetical protein
MAPSSMADVAVEAPTESPAVAESTPSTPASAPSTSAAPPDIRGETEAAWKQAAGADSPSDAPREIPPPAQPATQADGLAATPAQTGHIPLDRHQAVLTKQRNEADRQIAEIRQKYAWAEQLSPEDQGTIRWLLKDPAGAIAYLQQRHAQHQPAPPPADPEPQADIELQDGSKFYSAGQQQKWAEWRERKLEQRITGQFAPMLQNIALKELQTQTNNEASQLRAYYHAKFRGFKELEPDIKELCLKNPNMSIEHAYSLVFNEKGLAKERESWEAERAGRLQQKAGAASVIPGRAQPSTPKADRDKSIKEIVRESWQSASA